MPASTSPEKIALIEAEGGSCHLVDDATTVYDEAQRLAAERDGYFLDQFTYAERATDWRGNNNIAESIFSQMALERHPVPAWIVVGAGTGGTSATIGRYARFGRYATRMCVVDPEDSIFYSAWTGEPSAFTGRPSRIEGIGRQRVEPSFLPDIVDRMIQVPDAASIATMRLVRERTGRSVGGSTGTNVWGAFLLDRRDARAWRARQRRHPDLRRRRPLRRHVLQRRVGRRSGPRARAVHARRSRRSWRAAALSVPGSPA